MAKILLVEDDNNLREIYQARLSAEGYEIISAQNGEEALVMAKQHKPDLIISDVMMPRISGFEMLDILRNTDELKATKIIMLTALGQAEDKGRADNLGADKYLVKSQVTLEDIINAAKELLGETPTAAPAVPIVTTSEAAPTEPVAAPAEPAAAAPQESPVTAVPAPITSQPEPVAAPDPVADPQSVVPEPTPAAPAAPPATLPDDNATATPASVVPQPDTTVVVPPAPADPTPPSVTVTPVAPAESVVTPSAPPVMEPTADLSAVAPEAEVAAPAETAEATDSAQSLDAEEAALQAQIDNFSQSAAPDTPATEPATAPEPSAEATNDAANDEAIANAVKELNESPTTEAAEPETEPSTTAEPDEPAASANPAPATGTVTPDIIKPTEGAAASESDHVTVVGKKVIQPLNDLKSPAPNLNELLAKEEGTSTDAPVVDGQPATPPTVPGSPTDPNSISL